MTAAPVVAPAGHVPASPAEAATARSAGIDARVLVVGNYRPTIATVRSLGRAGYRLVVGCPPLRSYAEKSRHVDEAWAHPPLEDVAFAPALLAFLAARPDIDAIFPVSGLAIMRLCEVQAQLPRPLPVAMPDPRLVDICDDKTALLDVAERVGVPYPAWMVVPDAAELRQRGPVFPAWSSPRWPSADCSARRP